MAILIEVLAALALVALLIWHRVSTDRFTQMDVEEISGHAPNQSNAPRRGN